MTKILMKKNKRIITLIFSLTMIMLFAAACDDSVSQEQLSGSSASDGGQNGSTSASEDPPASDGTQNGSAPAAEDSLASEEQPEAETDKSLVAYFSRVGSTSFDEDVDAITSASLRIEGGELIGNMQILADIVQKEVDGDVFQIITEEPYPSDYEATVDLATEQRESGFKPELKSKVENMDSYNTVYLGYPIWGGNIPAPIASFLSEYDFSGKTIVPFSAHGGYGLGRSIDAIKELCTDATVLEAFEIEADDVENAQAAVSAWLSEIGG
ncbi:MAG: flavodoxin [Clostridiaceae bacterium]|nr:flavodoxin [Clostridiaceae bacterium]